MALAIRNWGMILLLFLFNLLFAGIAAVPMHGLLDKFIGHSLVSQQLTESFSLQFLFEFLHENRAPLDWILPMVIYLGLFYLLLNTLLLGGVIHVFRNADGRFTLEFFFHGCGKFFFRFLRLFLLSLPFFLLTGILWMILNSLLRRLGLAMHSEVVTFWLFWLRLLLLLVLLFFVNMIFDYAKIGTVVDDSKRMWKTARTCIKFVFRNLGRTLALYYLIALLGLLFLAVYILLSHAMTSSSGVLIVLLVVFQQVYMFLQVWFRLTLYSSQMALFRALALPTVPGEILLAEE